jgi:protein-S-isoprenylcysteine O-methyltransferase Ste14
MAEKAGQCGSKGFILELTQKSDGVLFLNQHYKHRQFPAGNPLANALVVIVGALAIGASFVLGLVAFVALGSIVLVLAAIIGIRVWWLNKRMGRQFSKAGPERAAGREIVKVIEGEYRVVSTDKKRQDGD